MCAQSRSAVGYKRAMTNARRFQLDELTIRPGSYFNPQTEIMIIVDDSPDVDHELFDADVDSDDWVLISDEVPVDEHKRDELVERFQQTYKVGGELTDDDDDEDDPLGGAEEEEEEEEDDVEELGGGGALGPVA